MNLSKMKSICAFIIAAVCSMDFLCAQTDSLHADHVFYISKSDILEPSLANTAITRNEFSGFYDDFLVLHCLIKKFQPKNLFEIGTCEGVGTMIIKNAIGSGTVYSLDLPPNVPKEYWFLNEKTTGRKCNLSYVQLFGDSMTYDYAQQYPIDSWFIDGEHDYIHAFYESTQALLSQPSYCFWHDTDIPDIFQAVLDTFGQSSAYNIYRVVDTRITFAIKKDLMMNNFGW